MFLTSTSDIVRIITGSAVSTIGVQAAWVDSASGSYTPGRTNTNITTAITTTVVGAPAASMVRKLKSLIITNNNALSSCVVTIQHFDGTTSVDIKKITLAANESFVMAEDGDWRHMTSTGAEYEQADPSYYGGLGITGTVAETIPRHLCTESSTVMTSGVARYRAIYLSAGQIVTNISLFSSTTAAASPTFQQFALYAPNSAIIARTADAGTAPWPANTIKTLALPVPYTVPFSGVYYIGALVIATTGNEVKGMPTPITLGLGAYWPYHNQGTSTGLTALPNSAVLSQVSAGAQGNIWAAVT